MLKMTATETTHDGARPDVVPVGVADVPYNGRPPMASPPTLAEADDATLVAAARDKPGEALEILIQRHQRQALCVALRFTRVREDAEDIVQESFLKAFLHLRQFEGRSSFSTWLTRIVINEAMMLRRRKHTSRDVPIEGSSASDGSEPPLDVPSPLPSPEDSCIQREHHRLLSAAMSELTPGVRKAIKLCELDELSTRETARVMGLSVAAVKSRLFHGRRRLRKLWKGLGKSTWERETGGLRADGKASFMPPHPLSCSACD